jgi:hypothetical protein
MSGIKDDSLDHIISNLNNIRDQLDPTIQASSSSSKVEDTKDITPPEEDTNALALEAYLASRLQQIGEISHERQQVKEVQTGNGWNPDHVTELVYKIEPISIKRATEITLSLNRSFKDRLSSWFNGQREATKIVGTPLVEFVPIWKVKGFHECYYLRTNSYKVNVKNDVVAVDVEGKNRDLILEKKHRTLIPSTILERFQKLGSFLSNESKYFLVSDALELATKKNESELTITGAGKPLSQDQEIELTSWRNKRVFDDSDLKVRGARTRIRQASFTKETLLNKFKEKVIHMPERFKQILSNRLQILELKRIYVPFIRISVQKGLVPREVILNGTNGEIPNDSILELLE